MGLSLTVQFLTWQTGWFWGDPNHSIHILLVDIVILSLGIKLDIAIL